MRRGAWRDHVETALKSVELELTSDEVEALEETYRTKEKNGF